MFRTASPSTEVAQSVNSKNTKVTPGRSVRAAKAGLASVFAMGLLSVAAMPAYAESAMEDSIAFALKTQPQQLIAAEADDPNRAGITVESVLQEIEVEEPATELAEGGNAASYSAPQIDLPAIPSGSKSAALVRAAFNQLGVDQDCTDAVQNALAEIGLFQRRDQGGYDLGPMAFAQFGTPIHPSQAAPGDILLRPGHVFVYTGNNTGIHGGWPGVGGGLMTTTDSSEAWSSPYNYTVIRLH